MNSTDETFSSTGNLDRAVFQAGGHNLQKECEDHSPCNEGEVILTGGHTLPVKHVLHAIPPQIYSTDTLDVLRDMYRKILHMASYLKATSIAIPSLGTGKFPMTKTTTGQLCFNRNKQNGNIDQLTKYRHARLS